MRVTKQRGKKRATSRDFNLGTCNPEFNGRSPVSPRRPVNVPLQGPCADIFWEGPYDSDPPVLMCCVV